jgi:hypothetical protein
MPRISDNADDDYDNVYAGDDANDIVVITMTRRQWWHIDDWRGEYPTRYPKRAAERTAAWAAIDNPTTP